MVILFQIKVFIYFFLKVLVYKLSSFTDKTDQFKLKNNYTIIINQLHSMTRIKIIYSEQTLNNILNNQSKDE